jgi:hypothetical protein
MTRILYSLSLDSMLDGTTNLLLPVWMPRRFAEFATYVVELALMEAGLVSDTRKPTLTAHQHESPIWEIDALVTWQHLDRRIDERVLYIFSFTRPASNQRVLNRVFEVLWAFHHTMACIYENELARNLCAGLSTRAIRKMPLDDKFIAFAQWVGQPPADPTVNLRPPPSSRRNTKTHVGIKFKLRCGSGECIARGRKKIQRSVR